MTIEKRAEADLSWSTRSLGAGRPLTDRQGIGGLSVYCSRVGWSENRHQEQENLTRGTGEENTGLAKLCLWHDEKQKQTYSEPNAQTIDAGRTTRPDVSLFKVSIGTTIPVDVAGQDNGQRLS
ncbi:MAG: hypothetical protein JKY34_02990 [Kordiimonadaceae bacterium]|nr:hypothetical protein [Kordiimonadaceae bacterium]